MLAPESEYIQKHLQAHTDFEGEVSPTDKVCETCYRAHLTLLKLEDDSSDGADFETLVNRLKSSLPILAGSTSTDDLTSLATKITIVTIAQELLSNHALTLNSAYNIFTHQIQTIVPMSPSTGVQNYHLIDGYLVRFPLLSHTTWPTPAK